MSESTPQPGSIADTLARILLWCKRSDHGFIRVVFDDGRARDSVVENLEQELKGKLPFNRLDLPPAANADILSERLADELGRLGPGVVSISGFEASLPAAGPEIGNALRALNARRENYALPGQHTIWWFPRHVAHALSAEHHDLNSWFLKRVDLTESLSTPQERELRSKWNEATRLYDAAQYLQAESIFREILKHEEAHLPPNHPRVSTALNNFAQLLQATNRLSDAEPLMRRALAIDEASFGKNHPNVARDLNNLANLLQVTNRLSEAEPLMRRVVTVFEVSMGKNHPMVATALSNLAQLLQDTNRLSEAEPLMIRALAINEASFGKDHPDVAIDLNNLAQLLQATNRLDEAEPLMRRHLEIFLAFARKTGHPHPHLSEAITNYAKLLDATGKTPDQILEIVREMAPEQDLKKQLAP